MTNFVRIMRKKSGFVAIIGSPNAGKSTLLNAILGQDISIVTSKPQTTRNKIFGIYTKDSIQIVFVDTPGILDPKYKLQQFMKKEIESSMLDAEIIMMVVDSGKFDIDSLTEIYKNYRNEFSDHKIFCILNKIDLLSKEEVLHLIKNISDNIKFDEIIPVSALTKFNVEDIIKTIVSYLPEGEFYFDGESVTPQPEKFFVSEIIRRNILKQYRDEIPFSVYVDIEEFKERDNGKDFIRASIIVERDSQKAIVVGAGGMKIKHLGSASRKEIEVMLGRQVFLELFVKVKKDWKNDDDFLRRNFNKLGTSTV
jgi:GTP-binding protein Era